MGVVRGWVGIGIQLYDLSIDAIILSFSEFVFSFCLEITSVFGTVLIEAVSGASKIKANSKDSSGDGSSNKGSSHLQKVLL